jgi:hypothetical protein
MSSQGNRPLLATVIVGVIVIAALVSSFVLTSSNLSSLSRQNTDLSQQLSNVNQQDTALNQEFAGQSQQISSQNQELSSLGQQVSNLNQQVSGLGQQDSSLSQQVSTLEQRTLTVVTMTNTVVTLETTTSTVTTTQTSVTAVPEATLVVTGDSYNGTSQTFTFQVQNTQNFTIYAQLHAVVDFGSSGACFPSDKTAFFISQVYTWLPNQTIPVAFNITLISYTCGSGPGQGQFSAEFMTANNAQVSPVYDFQFP